MSMLAGTVSVNTTNGSHTGTGMALAVINAMIAAGISLPDPSVVPPGVPLTLVEWQAIAYPSLVATKQFYAQMSIGIATGVVTHVTANAQVTTVIGVADSALQQAGGIDTTGPTAPRTLGTPGTIT